MQKTEGYLSPPSRSLSPPSPRLPRLHSLQLLPGCIIHSLVSSSMYLFLVLPYSLNLCAKNHREKQLTLLFILQLLGCTNTQTKKCLMLGTSIGGQDFLLLLLCCFYVSLFLIHPIDMFLPVTEDFSCPFCLVRCGSFKVKTSAEFPFYYYIRMSLSAAICGQSCQILTCYTL